jgi:hypothetical protein
VFDNRFLREIKAKKTETSAICIQVGKCIQKIVFITRRWYNFSIVRRFDASCSFWA